MSAGKLVVIVGGQFGSEAKGTIAAHLAATTPRALLAVRVAGPNAGHTVWCKHDNEHKLRSVPVAAAVRSDALVALAAGSEIDPDVLRDELYQLRNCGHDTDTRLLVDAQATVIEPHHYDDESHSALTERIGSTGKGVGAARASRIMREAATLDESGQRTSDVADIIRRHLRDGGEVHIEGTQGYGLGLHAGYYPYCTSSDCRAIDFMGMAGISPWDPAIGELEIWIVYRTYPIRVAGNSGPLGGELSWEQLSQRYGRQMTPERTTVTNKIRRIGEWDIELAKRALAANGGASNHVHLALTFLDYPSPNDMGVEHFGDLTWAGQNEIGQIERQLGRKIELVGTSARTLIDRRCTSDRQTERLPL